MLNMVFFFFSSRRRHTRWNCDWSSDVCSSDLLPRARSTRWPALARRARAELPQAADEAVTVLPRHRDVADDQLRVEFRHGAPGLLRRRDCADLGPRLPQDLLHRLAGRLIVVDDEDAHSAQPRGIGPRASAFG